jgi:hypothetical protein
MRNSVKALECYAYRVFLSSGRRSNAGKSSFYRWGDDIFTQQKPLSEVTAAVYGLTRYYAPEESFVSRNDQPANWYATRNRLRYTLFEYELYLLATEGQGKEPDLKWELLKDSTIEHILPQTPDADSHWKAVWSSDDFNLCLHDIANLVLTQDNSRYLNFEFSRKKGKPGESPSYSNSDIRQERRIARFGDWTRKAFDERRAELVAWLNQRWKTEDTQSAVTLEVADVDDEDSSVANAEGITS